MGQGVKPGLERISGLLDLMARPDNSYPIIHVAGTNGKTSTARMISMLVSSHGLTSGLFTSPHLDAVEDRFEVSGFKMEPAEFAGAVADLMPLVELFESQSGESITYFELTAALAFAWFAERAVDVGVIEVGLGGRWDATNAADSATAVVTNVSLEHTEYLGTDVGSIAAEKLAILGHGSVLVTGPLHPDAEAAAGVRTQAQEARWFRWQTDFDVADPQPTGRGWTFGVSGIHDDYEGLELNLHGRHQVINFALAVAAVESFFDRGLDEAAVREAAARSTSPGRMEVVQREPLLMMDGAHNPAGMRTLAAALEEEFPGVRWRMVIGVMEDKDLGSMLDVIGGSVASIDAVSADSPRALAAGEVAGAVSSRLGIPAEAHESVAAGIGVATASEDPVLITGSIYVVGEARKALGLS